MNRPSLMPRPLASSDAAYLQLLRSTDTRLAAAAARALAHAHDAAVLQALIDALDAPDPMLADAACTSLVLRGDPAAVAPLLTVLRTREPADAERLLGVLRDLRAWPIARAVLARA